MTTRILITVSSMVFAFALSVGAQAQTITANPNGIDPEHYKCYVALDPIPPFQPRTVDLQDQFGKRPVRLQKISFICTPVSKNGEVVADRLSHLVCYQFSQPAPDPVKRVEVKNQFGVTQFTVGRAGHLCVPSFKRVCAQTGAC